MADEGQLDVFGTRITWSKTLERLKRSVAG